MESYADEEKRIMSLIVQGIPSNELYIEYKNLRDRLNKDFEELRETSAFLEALAKRYNIEPPIPVQQKVSLKPSSFTPSSSDMKQRSLKIALKYEKDGVIDTKAAVPEIKATGDTRSEIGIQIGLGNMLFQRGWKKVDNGKFMRPNTQPKMEVK